MYICVFGLICLPYYNIIYIHSVHMMYMSEELLGPDSTNY